MSGVVLRRRFECNTEVFRGGESCLKGSESSVSPAPNLPANSFVFRREKSDFNG